MEINSLFKKYFNNQEFIDGFMEAETENPILTESINKDFEYKDNTIEDMSKAKGADSLGENIHNGEIL